MPLRFLQISIVLFWLVSVGWLGSVLVTPDGRGMREIDPRRAANLFFDWNDSTRMTLLQDGRKLGEVTVMGFEKTPEEMAGFSISGSLTGIITPPIAGTFVSLLVKLEDDFSLATGSLIVRVPARDLNLRASVAGEHLKAEIGVGENRVFAYDSESQSELNPAMMGMLGANPMTRGLMAQAGAVANKQWNLKAFRGRARFAGRRLPVYLLKMKIEELNSDIRLYLSESGEPLKIETDIGFEAISEVLVPMD